MIKERSNDFNVPAIESTINQIRGVGANPCFQIVHYSIRIASLKCDDHRMVVGYFREYHFSVYLVTGGVGVLVTTRKR